MKIIPLHTDIKKTIIKATKNDRMAQKMIYDRFAPKMLSVCRMYVNDLHFAEDVMVKGFFKVFQHLDKFKHEGSFEGWIRKIMVRESIDYLRSLKKMDFTIGTDGVDIMEDTQQMNLRAEDEYVQFVLDGLPEGYRAVFMMSVIEEYSHQEIAQLLDISEGTSRSQLFKAKRMLRERLKENENGKGN